MWSHYWLNGRAIHYKANSSLIFFSFNWLNYIFFSVIDYGKICKFKKKVAYIRWVKVLFRTWHRRAIRGHMIENTSSKIADIFKITGLLHMRCTRTRIVDIVDSKSQCTFVKGQRNYPMSIISMISYCIVYELNRFEFSSLTLPLPIGKGFRFLRNTRF